jgi:hypothetical protein
MHTFETWEELTSRKETKCRQLPSDHKQVRKHDYTGSKLNVSKREGKGSQSYRTQDIIDEPSSPPLAWPTSEIFMKLANEHAVYNKLTGIRNTN